MIRRVFSKLRSSPINNKVFSRAFSSETITVDVGDAYTTHLFDAPSTTVTTNKDELISFFRHMYTMRRMEITCDTEYKARNIRGFCHLYDGQEAVAMGIEAALDPEDSWITSYRCHGVAYLRGSTVENVFAELFGYSNGTCLGKGGSMHFYSKNSNFYGGQGIVGAQVPVGAGLAFANKYNTPEGQQMPIAIAGYGDGAANQGQIWEAANMSSLWGLPMVFYIENNHYGMGTSTQRSSSNDDYYTMGNHIPGIRMNGMNVLAVKQGFEAVKAHCGSGNGPMYVEVDTYRYHGHSMSDPGTTYRNREEVSGVRDTRDPIDYVKNLLIEHSFATTADIKAMEKEIRGEVAASLAKAKAGSPLPEEWLTKQIYSTADGQDDPCPFVRMPDIQKSIHN
jgi:pyruvate dehydrogenase E1 component alpha subunit